MGEAIDEPLLRAAGFGPGARAIPLRGGQGRSWQVRSAEGEPLVLKLSGSRWGAELVAAEQTALELAANAGLPVPLPRQSGSYGEAHFLVRDWVEGVSLTETLRRCPLAGAGAGARVRATPGAPPPTPVRRSAFP